MGRTVDDFKDRWDHINAMTSAFVDAVPDQHWDATPHPGFASFSKQLRHVACVRGVYNDGLVSGRVDFSRKHEHYSGGLTRDELVPALANKHDELLAILQDDARLEAPDFTIDFFGRPENFAQYSYTMVQHEALHHGQWALYAAHGGYAVPSIWRIEWGLGAGSV